MVRFQHNKMEQAEHTIEPDKIRACYVNYFFWKDYVYKHVKNIASVEDLPSHAMSIKVRLDELTRTIDTLETYWKKIGFDFQPLKEAVQRKFENPSASLEKRCVEE